MKFLDVDSRTPHVGLSYGPTLFTFLSSCPDVIDYVEIPFEQLRHSPELIKIQEQIPLVLHCASLSVAGFVPPEEATIKAIDQLASKTHTPWIGEHLAFISAERLPDDPESNDGPVSLSYTLCPQLSETTLIRVSENLERLQHTLSTPLILENAPQYFSVPGSTMNMVDFMVEVVDRCDVDLLLDLSHFLITSINTGVDAAEELARLPLERVVEVHISGLNTQSGLVWDDHASPAPARVFEMFEQILERARPRAVTLEYNWSPSFPQAILLDHIEQVRELMEVA